MNKMYLWDIDEIQRQHGRKMPFIEKFFGFLYAAGMFIVICFPLILIPITDSQTVAYTPTYGVMRVQLDVDGITTQIYEAYSTPQDLTADQVDSLEQFDVLSDRYFNSMNFKAKEDIKRLVFPALAQGLWFPPEEQCFETAKDMVIRVGFEFHRPEKETYATTVRTGTLNGPAVNGVEALSYAYDRYSAANESASRSIASRTVQMNATIPVAFLLDYKAGTDQVIKSPTLSNKKYELSATLNPTTGSSRAGLRGVGWSLTANPTTNADGEHNHNQGLAETAFQQLMSSQTCNNSAAEIAFLLINTPAPNELFSFIADLGGVLSLYITVVLVVGKFVRTWFDRMSQRMIYTDMPQTTSLSNLLFTIYMARENKMFNLEEELFRLFVRIYRSPEALMAWTNVDLLHQYGSPTLAKRQSLYIYDTSTGLDLDDNPATAGVGRPAPLVSLF
jgi:hypothetical protein